MSMKRSRRSFCTIAAVFASVVATQSNGQFGGRQRGQGGGRADRKSRVGETGWSVRADQSGLISTFRNLTTPAAHCNPMLPRSAFALSVSPVCTPFSTTTI
jgi:hypothetical protein